MNRLDPFRDVAIVGIGKTQMGRTLPTNTVSACLEALKLAVADAGLDITDIDGISARWPGPGGTVFVPGSADWGGLLGTPLRWISDTYPQGIPAAIDAACAIAAGQCEVAVVVGGQAGVLGGGKVASYTRPDNEFIATWGSITQAQFALVAQVYFDRFAPDREKLAGLAATIRNTGSINPESVMAGRGPYTAADVLASPLVASPFHLLEVCLATEGAAAIVLTSTRQSPRLSHHAGAHPRRCMRVVPAAVRRPSALRRRRPDRCRRGTPCSRTGRPQCVRHRRLRAL